jgi:hypothetical protein
MHTVFRWGNELRRHRILVDAVLFALNCDHAAELRDDYGVEYALLRNSWVGYFAEIHSLIPLGHSAEDIRFSSLKFVRSSGIADCTRVPCILVIEFEDGSIRATKLNRTFSQLRWCASTFGGIEEEICIVIPREHFKPLLECVDAR